MNRKLNTIEIAFIKIFTRFLMRHTHTRSHAHTSEPGETNANTCRRSHTSSLQPAEGHSHSGTAYARYAAHVRRTHELVLWMVCVCVCMLWMNRVFDEYMWLYAGSGHVTFRVFLSDFFSSLSSIAIQSTVGSGRSLFMLSARFF